MFYITCIVLLCFFVLVRNGHDELSLHAKELSTNNSIQVLIYMNIGLITPLNFACLWIAVMKYFN